MSTKTYLLVGWSTVYQDPGFSQEFETKEAALEEIERLMSKEEQTSYCLYEATLISTGSRQYGNI